LKIGGTQSSNIKEEIKEIQDKIKYYEKEIKDILADEEIKKPLN
jgi:hypothetical protein